MRTKGTYVVDLPTKIDTLVEAMVDRKWVEQGKMERASRPSLARMAGIIPETLKAAVSSYRMTDELRNQLASACTIDLAVPYWVDTRLPEDVRRKACEDSRRSGQTGYQGADTAERFRVYLRQALSLDDFGQRSIRNVKSQMFNADVAAISVSGSGQQTEATKPIPVFLEVDISPSFHGTGYAYGFRRVRIKLLIDEDQQLSVGSELGGDQPATLSDAQIERRGTAEDPRWEMFVSTGVLNGNYRTKDAPLCLLRGGQIGTEFIAELVVQMHDGSLSHVDGTELATDFKTAIIELLMAKRLAGDSSENFGWLTLGRQSLRIVRVNER